MQAEGRRFPSFAVMSLGHAPSWVTLRGQWRNVSRHGGRLDRRFRANPAHALMRPLARCPAMR